MSKKHQGSTAYSGPLSQSHETEYRVIKHDLIRVILLNVLYLAALLVVFYTNQKTGYLEHWVGKIFHF